MSALLCLGRTDALPKALTGLLTKASLDAIQALVTDLALEMAGMAEPPGGMELSHGVIELRLLHAMEHTHDPDEALVLACSQLVDEFYYRLRGAGARRDRNRRSFIRNTFRPRESVNPHLHDTLLRHNKVQRNGPVCDSKQPVKFPVSF